MKKPSNASLPQNQSIIKRHPEYIDLCVSMVKENPRVSLVAMGREMGVAYDTIKKATQNQQPEWVEWRRRLVEAGWLGADTAAETRKYFQRMRDERAAREAADFQWWLSQCIPCAGGCGLSQFRHPKGWGWMCDRCERRTT